MNKLLQQNCSFFSLLVVFWMIPRLLNAGISLVPHFGAFLSPQREWNCVSCALKAEGRRQSIPPSRHPQKEASITQQHPVFMETHQFIYSGLFILRDRGILHGVYSDAEEPVSLFRAPPPPRGLGREKAADLFISFAARDRDREDVSPINKARPTRTPLVSLCLFGISTEVLPHQTFLFKCCQHHMSGRQIDWGLLHISSLETCDWALGINKPEPVIGPAPPPHILQTPALVVYWFVSFAP